MPVPLAGDDDGGNGGSEDAAEPPLADGTAGDVDERMDGDSPLMNVLDDGDATNFGVDNIPALIDAAPGV